MTIRIPHIILTAVLVLLFVPGVVFSQNQSGNVSLVWESESYTPPFYRGKALAPDGVPIRFIALPASNLGDPSALHYTWKINGLVRQGLSGTGRQTFLFSGSRVGRRPFIGVEVRSSADGDIIARQALRVPNATPLVFFYERDPLLGVLFERALSGSKRIETDEIRIETYPYHFSTSRREFLSYDIAVNGRDVSQAPSFVLRKGEGVGSASVSISIENPSTFFESANSSFGITF